jgi:putative hydrolase of the HAD superfamily
VSTRDIAAVLLDAGNTLICMRRTLVCEVLAGEGIASTPEAVARAEAAARPAISRQLAAGGSTEADGTFLLYVRRIVAGLAGEDPAADDGLVRRLLRGVRSIPTQQLWSEVLPGVPEALAALRDAGIRRVVVSNSDGTVEQGLADAGLGHLLDAVVDSAVVGVEKPHPGIFEHALAAAGVRPSRALHVGDLYAVDVVGARAAGVHALLLDPFDDWPDVDCLRARDLADAVRRLLNGGLE